MFSIEDIITTQSYKQCCDYIYEAATGLDNIPPSCVIYTSNDHLAEFCNRVRGNNQKYVVVSSHSDFCLYNQSLENGPTGDMQRYFNLIKHQYPNIGYQTIQLPICADITKCNPNHKYILKCYRFSHSSFDEIPDEIQHIFMVNCCIDHPKITKIPFGLMEDKKAYFANIDLTTLDKTPAIYVNFADYTLERVKIKQKLLELSKGRLKGKVVVEEKEVGFEEYLANIKKYLFVLSLDGNGIDGYRNIESIYCGSLPIYPYVLHDIYDNYGIYYNDIVLDRIDYYLTYHQDYKNCLQNLYRTADYKQFKLSYWKEQINKKRGLLC